MASESMTVNTLRKQKACKDQVDLFASTFPKGAAISKESVAKAWTARLDLGWLAKNATTLPVVLDTLSRHGNEWVRVEAARNASTPPVALELLSHDSNTWVRGEVARNPAAPPAALELLSHDGNSWVRGLVALNPATPSATLALLSQDDDTVVRRSCNYRQSTMER